MIIMNNSTLPEKKNIDIPVDPGLLRICQANDLCLVCRQGFPYKDRWFAFTGNQKCLVVTPICPRCARKMELADKKDKPYEIEWRSRSNKKKATRVGILAMSKGL